MEGFFGQKEPHFKINLPALKLAYGNLSYGVSTSRIEESPGRSVEREYVRFF